MTVPADKLAYTIEEAAAAGPWGKSKLYELMAAGTLKSRKQFGRRYIMRDDFMAVLLAVEPTGPDEAESGDRAA